MMPASLAAILPGPDAAGTPYSGAFAPTGDMSVYPVIQEGHYLRFDSQGGSAVVSQFVPVNGTTTAPDDEHKPIRAGYQFDGWYDAAGGGNAFTFGGTLTSDIILYAHWTPVISKYYVYHWFENADDNDYYLNKVEEKEATTDTPVTATNAFFIPRNQRYHFYDPTTFPTITVKGDNSSILNLYYERQKFNITIKGTTSSGEYKVYNLQGLKYLQSNDPIIPPNSRSIR